MFPGSDGKVREVAIGACNEHSLSCALNAHSPFFRGLNVKRLGGLDINFLRVMNAVRSLLVQFSFV